MSVIARAAAVKEMKMVILRILVCTILGLWAGYALGALHSDMLLNTGQIYDEAQYIPPDIASGFAYGKLWGICGGLIGLSLALVTAERIRVFWLAFATTTTSSIIGLIIGYNRLTPLQLSDLTSAVYALAISAVAAVVISWALSIAIAKPSVANVTPLFVCGAVFVVSALGILFFDLGPIRHMLIWWASTAVYYGSCTAAILFARRVPGFNVWVAVAVLILPILLGGQTLLAIAGPLTSPEERATG